MKKAIVWSLIILLVSNSAAFAAGIDTDKLMTLKPLCSERIAKQAADYESNKLWTVFSLGGVGLGGMSLNTSGVVDNARLGTMALSVLCLASGVMVYLSPGEPVTQNNALLSLSLTGEAKEEAAYTIMKANAIRSSEMRKSSSLAFMGTGLGWLILTSLANSATQSYKDNINLGAVVLAGVGLVMYLIPSGNEWEIADIDRALQKP